jgi:hypothetical protein
MPSENLGRVLEGVRALTAAERQELRARLDTWPAPSTSIEDDLDERLLAAGVIGHVPAPLTDLAPYRRWKPIAMKGKPLSETVIEERR